MKTSRTFRHSLLAAGACLVIAQPAVAQDKVAAGAALAAAAQDTTDTGTAIVVTGQRQAYRGDLAIKDIPQNIQVISSQVLVAANITRLDNALELSSGVARQNNFGGLWDAFAVRGFAGDENFPSGFLVNGFNAGRGYGGPRDASGIEKIEVLKGPNGALFGRGEPGGTVNLITKKPLFTPHASASLSVGSWNTFRGEADVTTGITDNIAFRVTGAAEKADSFRDYVNSAKLTVSPSVLFKFSDKGSISYEMEYTDQEVTFDRGVVAVGGKLGLIPQSRFLGEPDDGPTKVHVLGHQVQFDHELGGDWAILLGAGARDTTFSGFSSDAEIAAGRQTLRGVDLRATDTLNILSRQRRFRDYDTKYRVLRGELAGKLTTGSLVHHLIIGADWDEFKINAFQRRYRAYPNYNGGPIDMTLYNALDIYNPVYGKMPTPNVQLTDTHEVQKAWGIYIMDQIDVTDRLKIRLGGRYDTFKPHLEGFVLGAANGGNVNTPRVSYKKFNPQAGIGYDVTNRISVYASYGRGFRPNSGTDASGKLFEPETSKSYEVGAKYTSPGGRITGTIALFTMRKTNILTTDPVNAGFSIGLGEARSRGVEADLNARLPGDLQVYLNYAYTDAEVAKDILDPNFGIPITAGSPLINIPKHKFNALAYKNFNLGGSKLTLGGGLTYVSKRLGETATNFFLPSYALVKAFGAFEPTEHLRFSVDVNNLFNKRWYASSYSQFWVAPGAPRSITGKVSIKY